MPSKVITHDNDRIDQIARRTYGSERGGIVERILKANPHLAEQPAVLPFGIVIMLPDPPTPKKVIQTVKLWG